MRYLLILALLLLPFGEAIAITGPSSRFDWSLGRPTVTANASSACTGEATARFDWSLGQPTVVHSAGVTCTAAVAAGTSPKVIINAKTIITGKTIIP